MSDIITKVIELANKEYDGHFTLLKFTTNWRFCFGTLPETHNFVTDKMAGGKSMEEAMEKGLRMNINAYDIMNQIK